MVRPNRSELVELLLGAAVPAHRGMPLEQLEALWEEVVRNGYTEGGEPSPINRKRQEIMAFIDTNRDVLLTQLGCDGNCYAHPDSQVVLCWMRMKGIE